MRLGKTQSSLQSWLPNYPGSGPAIGGNRKERETWERAYAHYDRFRSHPYITPQVEDVRVTPFGSRQKRLVWTNENLKQVEIPFDTEEIRRLAPFILKELTRAMGRWDSRRKRKQLFEPAFHLMLLAMHIYAEPSELVAARFAAELAYDEDLRCMVPFTLSGTRPTRWYWEKANIRVRKGTSHQVFDGSVTKYSPPFAGKAIAQLKKRPNPMPTWVAGKTITESTGHTPNSYIRALDPTRPPLLAVKLAAELVCGSKSSGPNVVALELGHSAGPQALSVWLPKKQVHTASLIFDSQVSPSVAAGSADAVVMGIPSMRAMVYCMGVLRQGRMDRRLNDFLWSVNLPNPTAHVEDLVELGTSYLRPGGLLVVLGDPIDGVHHCAIKAIDAVGSFFPYIHEWGDYQIDTIANPALVVYPRRPWCPLGVLPPSQRMVSAWRKQ